VKRVKYIDISRRISPKMERYPSDPPVEISDFKSLKNGNSCNLLRLSFGSHTGTHIDAPKHIIDSGRSVDEINLDRFSGRVRVENISKCSNKKDISGILKKCKGILFKVSKRKKVITKEDAKLLVKNGAKIIGTEGLSIEDTSCKSHPVHQLLLKNGVIIIENLDLQKVKNGYYNLISFPLKIKKGDGAPVRAVLSL